MDIRLTPECSAKLGRLREILRSTGGCAIAYSGGADSTLLLAAAREVLGERSLAVIATSSTYPRREYEAAIAWVRERGIPHVVIVSEELDIPEFTGNPPERCYFCKRELFVKVREQADARGLPAVADGSNVDDVGDFRPGMRAARELGVISPLMQAGLTKAEIRAASRDVYALPTANKPSMACMSSRFPYGSSITRGKLRQVEEVEDFLYEQGMRTFRARHHGDLLRLELGDEELRRMSNAELRAACVEFAKDRGFAYVTLDLEGFRSGSMNEVLRRRQPAGSEAVERSSDNG